MIDILDRLQGTDNYVRLTLKNGEVLYGWPDCIVYDEDEDGCDTIKTIRFEPCGGKYAKYFDEDSILSFEICCEEK